MKIITYPDPILLKSSEPVERITDEIRHFCEELISTTTAIPAYGIAAVQVGMPLRLFTIYPDAGGDVSGIDPFVVINPEIKGVDGSITKSEGCLSAPGVYINIARPEHIDLAYTNIDGVASRFDATGIMARCVAHEMDHLNGIMFWDALSKTKRFRYKTKFYYINGFK